MSDRFQLRLQSLDITRDGNRIFVNSRLAGWLAVDEKNRRIFVSPRTRSKHYFRMFRGWGISAELLQYLKAAFVQEIQIKLVGEAWRAATVFDWIKNSVEHQSPGFEPQLILCEDYFRELQQ